MLERQLDELVSALYALTLEEKALVQTAAKCNARAFAGLA
jgi:hypothetical protein